VCRAPDRVRDGSVGSALLHATLSLLHRHVAVPNTSPSLASPLSSALVSVAHARSTSAPSTSSPALSFPALLPEAAGGPAVPHGSGSRAMHAVLRAAFPHAGCDVDVAGDAGTRASTLVRVGDLSELQVRVQLPADDSVGTAVVHLSAGKLTLAGCLDAYEFAGEVRPSPLSSRLFASLLPVAVAAVDVSSMLLQDTCVRRR
jgi:hypothetical protein